MEKSFGLLFYLKKRSSSDDDEIPIYVGVTANGVSSEISTKRKCDTSKWNVAAGRVEGKTEYSKSVNSYLEVLQRKIYEIKKRLEENDQAVTSTNIKQLLLGNQIDQQKYMLMEIFQNHNDQMAALVGQEYAPGTLMRYQTSYRHTHSFLQWKYKVNDIDIAQLDFEFISEYEFWLKSTRKCDHNSTIKSNFKKIVNRCLRNGWLQRDPFMGFRMTKREVERTALTENELKAMFEHRFSAERLKIVKDIFL